MPTKVRVEDPVRELPDKDPRLRHPSEVAVLFDEGVVTLRDTVSAFSQRLAAVRAARKVHGVDYVDDQLTVRVLDVDARSDAELRGMGLQAIAWDTEATAEQIDVEVTDGWVTPIGELSYQFQSDAADDDVANLFGVIGITNEIRVVN